MENKLYTLIPGAGAARCVRKAVVLLALFSGFFSARAADSARCSAQFFAYAQGTSQYIFQAVDSLAGVQHYWNFGDSTSVGYGNYVIVTHTYSHPGNFTVVHKVRNLTTGCQDSSTELISVGAPPPSCSIDFHYSHDSTTPNSPYYFYAQPFLAGATADTVSWFIDGTPAGMGDTLHRYLSPGTYTVCVDLSTNLGCRSQSCQTIQVRESATTVPPDSTRPTPPDSTHTPPDSTRPTPPDSTHTPLDSLINRPDSNFHVTDSLPGYQPSYPNPATTTAHLDIRLNSSSMIYIRVYNSMGSQVKQISVSGYPGDNHLSVPIGGLQQGIYYIQIQYGNEIRRSRIQKL
jgi:hypothetical protein